MQPLCFLRQRTRIPPSWRRIEFSRCLGLGQAGKRTPRIVLAPLFLVRHWPRLTGTVTAFTLAHSLTLAEATLGWLQVPQALAEAAVALGILFVATKVLHARHGHPGLAAREPWVVAFVFGLLHGLGFAGALREVGLPEHANPLRSSPERRPRLGVPWGSCHCRPPT